MSFEKHRLECVKMMYVIHVVCYCFVLVIVGCGRRSRVMVIVVVVVVEKVV